MKAGHAEWAVAAGHPATEGHFPSDPIIPGALLLQQAVAAIVRDAPGLGCTHVIFAKFHHPVRPPALLSIDWTAAAEDEVRFSCALLEGGEDGSSGGEPGMIVASGALRFGAA